MNEAESVAGRVREYFDGVTDDPNTILRAALPLLDRLAAIDAAVTGEVGPIRERHSIGECLTAPTQAHVDAWAMGHNDRATLLAIVERQAGEMAETRRARDAANERLEVAGAEVERLRAELDKVAARAMGVLPAPSGKAGELLPWQRLPLVRCAAGRDGDCYHPDCPQVREGEPGKSGRSCPLWEPAKEE